MFYSKTLLYFEKFSAAYKQNEKNQWNNKVNITLRRGFDKWMCHMLRYLNKLDSTVQT